MCVKWKIFRDSFPYICTECGEFSNSEKEFCEKCGDKDSLRKTKREDYENHIETIKAEAPKLKVDKKEIPTNFTRVRRVKTVKIILLFFFPIFVIDIIAFFIIMNILGIPFSQIGDNLWIVLALLGFSLMMFIIIIIAIYFMYYTRDIIYWIP